MINPTEILYWEILPAIRKEIVIELKNLGVKQADIARLLDITPSAVSQYINNKRGDFDFSDSFKLSIKSSAQKIKEGESTVFDQTNILIKNFKKEKDICRVCRSKNIIEGKCGVCYD